MTTGHRHAIHLEEAQLTFFWNEIRKSHVMVGSFDDPQAAGRKLLVTAFGTIASQELSIERLDEFVDEYGTPSAQDSTRQVFQRHVNLVNGDWSRWTPF